MVKNRLILGVFCCLSLRGMNQDDQDLDAGLKELFYLVVTDEHDEQFFVVNTREDMHAAYRQQNPLPKQLTSKNPEAPDPDEIPTLNISAKKKRPRKRNNRKKNKQQNIVSHENEGMEYIQSLLSVDMLISDDQERFEVEELIDDLKQREMNQLNCYKQKNTVDKYKCFLENRRLTYMKEYEHIRSKINIEDGIGELDISATDIAFYHAHMEVLSHIERELALIKRLTN